jgi:hypothetical protein
MDTDVEQMTILNKFECRALQYSTSQIGLHIKNMNVRLAALS